MPELSYAEKFNNMLSSIDNYVGILSESMLYDLRQSMNERILAAGKQARLDACDEKIYDAYTRLIKQYKTITGLYEGMGDLMVSPKLKNILEGILSVIRSRLALAPQGLTEDAALNPIFLEKKRILSDWMREFNREFDALAEGFNEAERQGCKEQARALFVTLYELDYDAAGLSLARAVAERQAAAVGGAAAAYAETVKGCVAQLNDSAARGEVMRYNELLEQERGILGTIVEVQAPLIEKERGCSATEETVAGLLMTAVAEADARLKADLDEIHTEAGASRQADEEPVQLWDERMLKSVLAATNYSGFAHCFKQELTEVCRSLEQELGVVTEREISNRLFARAMYDYRKLITAQLIIADEIIGVFERVAGSAGQLTRPEGDEGAIMSGIVESVQIKTESLTENKEAFAQAAAGRLKALRKERPMPELKELGALVPEIEAEVREAFFTAYRMRRQRHIAEYREISQKQSLAFKREHLLFEVITFEELMTYSVSRLRASADEGVSRFTECMDRAWAELEQLLSKNRIVPIAPKAHDIFNGREHEVLTAERNEDFKKGEIIKLMNRGYKQDDVVLVRANVIAAR